MNFSPMWPQSALSSTENTSILVATTRLRPSGGNTKVALVVDDLESISPWKPRGIKIHGKAEIVERQRQFGPAPYLKVTLEKYWSWGIERPTFEEGKAVIKKKRIDFTFRKHRIDNRPDNKTGR
jgi:hypothetical protein